MIETKFGVFLGNMHDPLNLDIFWDPDLYMTPGDNGNEFTSRGRYIKWLKTKTVAIPQNQPDADARELRAKGYIGVYYNEKNGDIKVSAEEVNPEWPSGRTDVGYLGQYIEAIYESRKR
jgi:hypothetical protein